MLNSLSQIKSPSEKSHQYYENLNQQDPFLEFQHVSYQYSKDIWALHDVSFAAHQGKFLALIGNNGSGKTTFLKMINGLLNPTEGQVPPSWIRYSFSKHCPNHSICGFYFSESIASILCGNH